ncbi:MAG: hypothetical protein R3B11_05945 [Nitrospira sp.]|nr:hypothetical protein [Nitrospira sp.]
MPGWFSFSNFADLASIVEFIISLLVLYNVNQIRAQFLFTARVPQLAKRLNEHASHLSAQYRDLGNSIEAVDLVKAELARCQSVLKSLGPKLPGGSRKSVKKLIDKIEAERKDITPASKSAVWEIYTELTVLIEDLKHIQEDRKWSA